jgi:hypothetical protein
MSKHYTVILILRKTNFAPPLGTRGSGVSLAGAHGFVNPAPVASMNNLAPQSKFAFRTLRLIDQPPSPACF